MDRAEQVCHAAVKGDRIEHVIEALVLEALILQEKGNLPLALAVLKQALAHAEPGGYIRMLVDEGPPMAELLQRAFASGMMPDYISKLLAVFGMQPPGQERIKDSVSSVLHPLLDPLSERELEVLRLIGEGHSNEEIAGALYISMGTVKTHLKHIYGKLNVHTRTQAIARGRELRILSSDPIGM
jgi:LuxR family maltose regulon positive regulatory protein